MNARHALLCLGVIGLVFATSAPAHASGKGKKGKAESAEPKSTDDLMNQAAEPTKKSKTASASESTAEEKKPAEEAVAEPDAWERPPAEEEKAPKVVATIPEKKVGDGRHFDAGLLLGWGFQTDKSFGTDPYQLGFGLRAGYEFDFHLYTGVGFEYFLGSSDTRPQGIGLPSAKASANYMFAHVEAGYDVWINKIILRPSIWLGLGFGRQDPDPRVNGQRTRKDFFFAPGVSVLYAMDGGIFIGGDARLQKVAGDGSSAFVLYLNGGLRF